MSNKSNSLRLTNARENNLKDLTLEIPHDEFTVVTGLSGSGKSSLAFDTVYAEGQRRYIETFSPYTRQFFDKVKKPDIDAANNVRPAIAIQQRTRVTNSRSTVGSMTNINDYLKTLWSNIARPVCPECETELRTWSSSEASDQLLLLHDARPESTFLVCARLNFNPPQGKPLATKKKSFASKASKPAFNFSKALNELVSIGFTRCLNPQSGEISSLEDLLLEHNAPSELLLVLDRVKSGSTTINKKRLQDSIDQAYNLRDQKLPSGVTSDGKCIILESSVSSGKVQHEFAPYFFCPHHTFEAHKARPAMFSFNHPIGACPDCKGFGKILTVSESLCVPNPNLSISERALQCWAGKAASLERRELLKFCEAQNISTSTPWKLLPPEQKDLIFNAKTKDYWGVRHWFKWLERKVYKMHVRVFLSRYRTQADCPACGGTRLKTEALSFRVRGRTLPDMWNMPVGELQRWIEEERDSLKNLSLLPRALAELFSALLSRLHFLNQLGVSYLTLERQARTLSGGETQRVNLATALGSELISTQFVLDEPSVGLHARDTDRLLSSIRQLTDKGNSLLVVEHDLDCIDAADNIIELGPEAGEKGGQVVYSGSWSNWKGLVPYPHISVKDPKENSQKRPTLYIQNARSRNLKGFKVHIPLQCFVTLTGVSGSGKSTLVSEVIKKAWDKHILELDGEGSENKVTGFENVSQVLLIDQSPVAKSPRANIATYTGVWDSIRDLLANSDDSQVRGLSRSDFSFNVDGGRCPACKGAGYIKEDMQFLSDVYVQCEVCLGKRFQQNVLEVRYKGKNVSDILNLTLEGCSSFFHQHDNICRIASTLCLLGLGHLTLGHALSDLSGGEAQRLKLIPYIQQTGHGQSLLIFDEPTTGLHYHDVQRLIELFKLLRDHGHSILCIEHNLSLIAESDWIIDLGPEGGNEGGKLLFEGTPYTLIQDSTCMESYTASFLRAYVNKYSGKTITSRNSGVKSLGSLSSSRALILKGAREHNLKDISLEIPLNQVVAITGVSGSGKSTIAKDIVYAEGQRRYLDCLSPYARQFIKELKKPDIDDIRNIKPTICVYQHTFQPTRLSTVATMSEVYNYLRLLYAKTGIQYCPDHPDKRIAPLSSTEIASEIKQLKAKNIRILAPVVKMKKGHHKAVFERAISLEIAQIRVDGIFLSPSTVNVSGGLPKTKPHSIEFVVGKFNPATIEVDLIKEAVEQALALAAGTLVVLTDKEEIFFSTERTCPVCKRGFFKPDPEDLSFNSKRGACPKCHGAGQTEDGEFCHDCHGARINPLGRNLRLGEKSIYEASCQKAEELLNFLNSLHFSEHQKHLARPVLLEATSRLKMLLKMGLDHLELSRDCSSLSTGELQRLRLATAMGSDLCGVLYIFDEPSAGLHPLDNKKVLAHLAELKDQRNSIIIIEHDPESILACDHVIDVGPGGGQDGGRVVFNGPIDEFVGSDVSPTAIAIKKEIAVSAPLMTAEKPLTLHLKNGSVNNIKELSIDLPLNSLTTIAGVSGAGKSSLLHSLISQTILAGKTNVSDWKSKRANISSDIPIARLLEVDQKPIGINSRSTPASYLKIWDEIRKLFAKTNEARMRGWGPGFFSYNSGKGRCPECKGLGQIKLEMSFLPDAEVLCETCGGSRYTEEAQSVKYLNISPSDVLKLTFEEARQVFANHRKVHRSLHLACELGLGYLTLGQSSTTLSGGESQRIKLVSELSGTRKGHTLYILDEPTTGLHKSDVGRLVKTLKELVARGNSVIVIEHDKDVLLASDHIIEMGPGPGVSGGKVVFQGHPYMLKNAATPWGSILRA